MPSHNLGRGLVVMVALNPVMGHEQAGIRPAIIVSDPARIKEARYPLVAVVPVTRTEFKGPFVVPLPSGAGGLTAGSFVLADQIRAIDVRRIIRVYSELHCDHVSPINDALRLFLGL